MVYSQYICMYDGIYMILHEADKSKDIVRGVKGR